MLELQAVRLSSERAAAATLAGLRVSLAAMQDALHRRDLRTCSAEDGRFHQQRFDHCGNRYLADAYRGSVGRTDALPAAGVDEALRRAKRYRDAGVDLVFVDGVKTVAEVEAIAAGVECPKVLSLVDGTDAARLTAAEVEQLGFSVLFHAVTALFAATRAVADALASLRATGAAGGGPAQHTYVEFTELVDLDHHRDLDDRFGA